MRIEKEYKFYAAHRNQSLEGKCNSLHGHRYGVTVVIKPERTSAGITMLFADIDDIVEPIIKELDHSCLVDINDPKAEQISITGKTYCFDGETSAENIAQELFCVFRELGLPIIELRLKETDSTLVIYDVEDYGSNT